MNENKNETKISKIIEYNINRVHVPIINYQLK